MTLEVALENLAADTDTWASAADTITTMSSSLAGLTLGEFVFTGRGYAAGVAYEEVRAHMESLTSTGGTELNDTVSTLRKIHADYADNEAAATARYNGMWTYDG
ncbi:hypothetical protein OCAE111667_11755 [Occultella aeris]|uniref:Uncharacterized protein n=1 Tax=Occultella aeris TaxID=2761496 RepID=A0A7M4DPV1_9MICO|nr:hypothetical protein [Occultella aeris]VZO39495.1 hypothetical protein HALOF300_04187 [Occultella aeris]